MKNMEELTNGSVHHRRLKVIIVGCGLSGLTCAIELRREGQDVIVLEKALELSEIGAGIQIPPNATKVMEHLGLLDELYKEGMMARELSYTFRWEDGSRIGSRPGSDWSKKFFGNHAHVIHRADYQRVLVNEAKRLGVDIRLGSDVVDVECQYPPTVILANGERMQADAVVGSDGLRSNVRTSVLGYVKEPEELGDLAYRITIPREALEEDASDPFIKEVLEAPTFAVWWGPQRHVVLYPLKHNTLVNMVCITPDDLPPEVSKQPGDLEEMRKLYEDWDPRLQKLLSKVDKALKWKIWGMEELEKWTNGAVALVGDSCHPGPPTAAQGAAIAVEDGAVLGRLLGLFARSGHPRTQLPELLKLYQNIRKERTTGMVNLAIENRNLYHMADGPEQQERDRLFLKHDWYDESSDFFWSFANLKSAKKMFAFDALQSADDGWKSSQFSRRGESRADSVTNA